MQEQKQAQTQAIQQQCKTETKASQRVKKWVCCFPETFKESFLSNEDLYAKWMLKNLANAIQLRDETILSNTAKMLSS